MEIINYVLYILAVAIIIYVMNRYFSGAKFNGLKPNLWGSVAVITGGNAGIGRETAIELAQQGCQVIIGARDTEKSAKLVQEINDRLGKPISQQYYLDLGDLKSIREFVAQIKTDKVDFLINNAGVMALPKRTLTKSGFQMQYGVNHLGHFYLTFLLWNKLKQSSFFRVINVSSLAHKKLYGFIGTPAPDFDDMNFEKNAYNPTLAYSRSKLYNNLFTHALAERLPKDKGLTVSLHPGVVRTELTRYMLEGWKQKAFDLLNPIYSIFTKSPWQGAQTTLTTVFSPAEKLKNGGYYSDCHLAKQNINVKKQNWEKLWQISQRDLNIKFQAN